MDFKPLSLFFSEMSCADIRLSEDEQYVLSFNKIASISLYRKMFWEKMLLFEDYFLKWQETVKPAQCKKAMTIFMHQVQTYFVPDESGKIHHAHLRIISQKKLLYF